MTDTCTIHFKTIRDGARKLRPGAPPAPKAPPPPRIPRISRLMALAIHFDGLIRQGVVRDYSDLARLGGISCARVTQIMNLLNLPPRRQEELLFLPEDSTVTEWAIRAECAKVAWEAKQDVMGS